MRGRGRSQSTLGFHRDPAGGKERALTDKSESSFWKDHVVAQGVRAASTSNVGRTNEPAASFSYDSRKKNLDPGRKKDLMAPPKVPPALTKSIVATKPAYKIRQIEREERAKSRYKIPEIVDKIAAEKQIILNPLLHPEENGGDDPGPVKNLTSLTLQDLCRLRIAFEKADEDESGALDQEEFVNAFLPVLGTDASEVHLLFMRIDADSDGTLSWEEFLSYVLSQDEGRLQIATESSRQLFDYPGFSDSALQIHGHKDSAGGLLHLEDTDRYVSFSRKGEVLLWRPDCVDSVTKIIHPREFQTSLPFITQLVHVKRLTHSDRLAICSADKQLVFLDLMRETTKLTGQIKVDLSPLCMCAVVVRDEMGEIVDEMICFGDDTGQLHLYKTILLNQSAERNMMSSNSTSSDVWGCKDAHLKTWKAHDHHAWISKVEYYDDSRMLISCASDGQLVISDALKGEVKMNGFRHRGDISDFVWIKKIQLLASCGLERHINMWQIPIKTPVYKLEGHQGSIQQLVYGSGQLISIDTSKTIIVWDLREMAPIQRLEGMKMHQEFPVGRMIYDHKKKGIVSMARRPLFWHITERKVPSGHTTPVSAAVYNPMFQTLVSADESSVVRVWNLNSGKAIIRFTDAHVNEKGEPVKITSTIFDRTHRRLVTGAHDGTIKLWNYSTGQRLKEFVGFGDGDVTALACMHMTPYNYIIATGWNRKVSFWLDPQSLPADKAAAMPMLKPQHHMEGAGEDILCMACYPQLHLLITGSYDGDIIIWNLDSGHPRAHLVLPGRASLKIDQKPIEAMQLVGISTHPDFKHKFSAKKKQDDSIVVLLFTASGDGVIRVWSTDITAELLLEMPLEKQVVEAGICALASCEQSKVFLAADNKGEVYVYDISGTLESAKRALPPISAPLVCPSRCAQFKAHNESISCLIYINTRRLVVTGSTDCTICLWTITGEKMGTFGEEHDWKLTTKIHDYSKNVEQAVFGKKSSSNVGSESEGNKKDKRRVRRTGTVGLKNQNSWRNFKDGESVANTPGGRSAANSVMQSEKGDDNSVSAFMTQCLEEEDEGERFGAALQVEEELDANWEDYYSSGSHSDSDSEIDDETVKHAHGNSSESSNRSLVLKEDIGAIIARGLAMKDRGEKFFEAGSREMGTYGKMIVRDLGDFRIPDQIQRKMHKAGKKSHAAHGHKGAAANHGDTSENEDVEEGAAGEGESGVLQRDLAASPTGTG